MIMRQRHLSDDRLIEVCLDATRLVAERHHLDRCTACENRRAHLSRLLVDASDVATAEADAVFSVERLARQRTRILQRLDQEGRPGRLIAFPASHLHGSSLRARPGMRWVAVAAAAGVVIGLLAGHLAHDLPARGTLPAAEVAAEQPVTTLRAVSMTLSEEEFLGRLEMAIEGTSGSALQPLDDLTPRVWEVAAQ